ncbi:Titin-like 21, partial [Homarus americanus]
MFAWLWSRKDKPRGQAPKILEPLKPLKVEHGSKAVLETTVKGQPTPKVLWYHLDREVVQSSEFVQEFDATTGRAALIISEVFIDDKGLYRCVAINQHGQDETASYVTVEDIEMLEKSELRQAPRITRPLQAQIVKTPSSLDLQARYEAFPPPTIKWYHKGKELKPSRDYTIEYIDDETSLHIEEVFDDDSGEYEVRVFNEVGEARSVATVIVTQPEEVIEMEPPKFIKPLQPQIVPEGEVAILEAEVTAKPPAEFMWYRHGQKITTDEELEVQITSEDNKTTLVLGELFEDDSGDYTITAQNPVGLASSTATLLVEGEGAEEAEPPAFSPPLTPIRVMDGEEVRFSCKVTGKPMPKLTWFQNGRPIGHHREVRLTQTPDGRAGLQILEVFPEDEGDYTCIARNKAGEARTTANLCVESYEYHPDSEAATTTSVSEKNVFSGPTSEEDETLEIEKDSESDSSEAGSSPYFCNRLEQKIEVIEGSSVRLLTKTTGYPRPTVKWHADGMPVEVTEALTLETYEDGTEALTLPYAVLDDCGEYTCEAMNRNGVDTTVTTLVVLPEHTEETSKAYRKPEWVTRMEDLKQAMSGIVERSRARRSGSQLHQTPSLDPSEKTVLQPSQFVSQTSSPMLPSSLPVSSSILQSSNPSSSPVTPKSTSEKQKLPQVPSPVTSCVSLPLRTFVDVQSTSDVQCALDGSVTSTSVTSMSVDSLGRPSLSCDPSCMSSRDTISECDTEYGSQTDTEYQSDSQLNEPQSDCLANVEVASCLSIGDLSIGSDSVFISETETVSDATSRRTSTYTVNPIYFVEDEQTLSTSKSQLLSPSTKHVHFKFDADTPSTMSEDERQTESPNFAQAVLSNYLSSHRNSISQVIEALSSLAQADITAEIEMTIEQNKKQKLCEHPQGTADDTVSSSQNLESSTYMLNQPLVIEESSGKEDGPKEKYPHDFESFSMQEKVAVPLEDGVTTSSQGADGDKTPDISDCGKVGQMTDSEVSKRPEEFDPANAKENVSIETSQSITVKDSMGTKTKEQVVVSTVHKVKRKSILKNTGHMPKPAVPQAPEVSTDHVKEGAKITRQLTPTLRRKPILKKKETMMSSSSSKHLAEKDAATGRKLLSQTGQRDVKEEVSKTSKIGSKNLKSLPKAPEQSQGHATRTKPSVTVSQENPKISSETMSESSKSTERAGSSETSQPTEAHTFRRSTSLPSTPVPLRKDRPSPPNKLPLVMSRGLSSDSLRESRIPRAGRSNESTPTSTPKQVRKFSPKCEEASSKIPKPMSREHSFDSLTDWTGSPKRNVWSEPSSPMSTPQLIRKTFKQIHENTKIPMPVYQYSSTEDLEDSSPQESPRPSREKRQRSLIRPPRTMSVDRAMDLNFRKPKDDSPKTSRTSSRAQSPLPVSPRIQSPTAGRVTATVSGGAQSPTLGRGKIHSPSQGSKRLTSPGSTPRTVLSPGSTPRTVLSPGSTPKLMLSPGSTPKRMYSPTSSVKTSKSPSTAPKILQSPILTPKRVLSPLPQCSLPSSSDTISKTGTRPKVPYAELYPLKESTVKIPNQKSATLPRYMSTSDSEQHSSSVGSGRVKSSRHSRSGGMRRADSLEEFLLLENECMD